MTLSARVLSRRFFALALPSLLAFATLSTPAARAQDHVVTSQALQLQVQASTSTRQQNIDTLNKFLSSPMADKAMRDHNFDPVKVRSAVPTLSDAELANLASRANDAQQKFSAGFLGLGMLLVILIAIVVIIVIVAVH